MGLITKAIEKVETQHKPLVQPEMPPESKSKRKIIILLVILIFLGSSLGGGYLFFLKPTLQVPSKVPQRSISARQKLSKIKPQVSPQNKDTLEAKTGEGKEDALEKTLEKSLTQQKPKAPPKAGEQEKGISAPQREPSMETALSQIAGNKEENQTLTPEIKPPQKPMTPSRSENKKKIPEEEEITSEGEKNVLSPDMGKVFAGTPPSAKENAPEEKAPTSPPAESKNEMSEKLNQEGKVVGGKNKEPSEGSVLASLLTSEKRSLPKPTGIIDQSNSRAEKFYNKGASYHQQSDYARAIDFYKKALSLDPGHKPTRMNLATAYLQIGRYKEAERELIFLYALKPLDPRVLFNLGLLLYQTGNHESAEAKLRKLLEIDSFNLEANLLLGSIYEEKGEMVKALELYMKAYRINSTDAHVLYKLGRAFDLSKDKENAIKYYRLFLQAPGENGEDLKPSVRDRLNYLLSQKEEK
jgi:Flp pilus assembly protein TadD